MTLPLFSPAAMADIAAVWDYTAEQWGADQADQYVDDIRDACRALADGRKLGRLVDLRPGYRSCPVGAHLIFFRERAGRLEVIRVLHGRTDFGRHL
ncbi:type II toxin-antitoxin system RelE/ParE family toxin [Neogemmobacter tilapiae]|uniref:Toxin n=1 Tax=Neogemmobacter tilapiae TaxID=875041 RepID=A0A918WGU6_9RHOB|nr:type II toxin-antitoxin system RelE/ParE family toxin [Gemmobacter tilapiae]GHC45368.1 plasmid stabilization protein ParE [Gemmobacter tilapiae]